VILKGDFAAGERTLPPEPVGPDFARGLRTIPASKNTGDFASGEHSLVFEDDVEQVPQPATVTAALKRKS
jgi:hypothetical protein